MSLPEKDGGYYAIKGFLYQFDKTIIDILDNPSDEIFIEKEQDISFEKYIIQVKHKETQDFSNSKIKKPILQLLEIYKRDSTKKLSLYCYFKNRGPQEWVLSVTELESILGSDESLYTAQIKMGFVSNFKVIFSENFDDQFDCVIEKIKNTFGLKEIKEALYHHSFFRSLLLQVALLPLEERKINKEKLKEHIYTITNHVFFSRYSEFMGREKFIKFIKKEYFSPTHNLSAFERLVIVDCDNKISLTEIIDIVQKIIGRWYRKGKSPGPYICLKHISQQRLNKIKSDLIDMGIQFTDGTLFNGDKFRMNVLLEKDKGAKFQCKFVNEEHIHEVIKEGVFKQYYHFFLYEYYEIETEYAQVKVELDKTNEVLRII